MDILQYFYKVPWCVPRWGAGEFYHVAKCICSGKVIDGRLAELFSQEIRTFLEAPYAIPVNRGRSAIELGLRAFGIKEGDHVVLPSYCCYSVLSPILKIGAVPVFADIDETLNVTPLTVCNAMTQETKCIIVPHLFGRPAPIDIVEGIAKEKGVFLIDDAAQAFGSRLGTRPLGSFGDAGILSCGPGKPLEGSAGGLLVTRRHDVYESAQAYELESEAFSDVLRRTILFILERRWRRVLLPFFVSASRVAKPVRKYPNDMCRLANIDAAVALTQFNNLSKNSSARKKQLMTLLENARMRRDDTLMDSGMGIVGKYPYILPEGRDTLRVISELKKRGIEAQRGYIPLHHRIRDKHIAQSLVMTEEYWARVVCLPLDAADHDIRLYDVLH